MRPAVRLCCLMAAMVAATSAFAQESQLRELVRNPNVRGLPPLEINLDQETQQRYALIIGNADYDIAEDLPNARSDAELVADLFRQSGYTVSEHYDLSKKGFENALRQALYEVDAGAEFAFYYAGHGVQIGDDNFLIPVDMEAGSVHDVRMRTVSLGSVLGLISSRARSLLVVLDSCRNNPFPELEAVVSLEDTPRPLQTGFAAPESPINSLVVFSTSPGAVALDGEGDNSPFTRAFVDVVQDNPARPLDELMKEIRRRVYVTTQKLQVPWSSSSLVEPIVLSKPALVAEVSAPAEGNAEPLQVSHRLDRRVPLSATFQSAVLQDEDFALTTPPEMGRLELREDGAYKALQRGQVIPANRLRDVVYSAQFDGSIQSGVTAASMISDRFELQIGGTAQPFNISLEIDACDREAGDHLDPESVGIARYPNEIEPETALLRCQEAVARAPGVGRFHYQLGRVQLAMKELEAARQSFEKAVDLGHTRAYHGLGTVELARRNAVGGQSREAAPEEALTWFLEGVKRGDPYAYHSLGLQLLKFPRTYSDRRHGFELLSRSLELGHTFSMNALGLYFLDKDADHYDAERGLRYLRESAARGDIYGYANLGFVSLTGAGGETVDFAKAQEMFRRASDGGHPAAASSLGRMYVNGQIPGQGKDLGKAIEWYDLGLQRGDAWGGANAAWLIANRSPSGFTEFDAAVRAAKAATLRDAEAAKAATKVLAGLSGGALDGGAQQLMVALGADITVDGAFGPGSRSALGALGTKYNRDFPITSKDRILALAKLYWENTKFRVDLY